jgi:N-acetylglucosaminyldiphosphoundecaprenol N-acetyl-beta-D-mannosaminyltransferase
MSEEKETDRPLAPPPSIDILGVAVHSLTQTQALDQVAHFMSESHLHQIATVNPEFVMKAQDDHEFKRLLNNADLCLADGIGLVLASRWLKRPLPARVAGSDIVYDIASLASRNGWRCFLLGAQPGVAAQAAQILRSEYSDLVIAGTYAGSPKLSENDHIVQLINKSKADIIFVAYGAPQQDKWINRNRDRLPNVRVAMGVGGSLDFITGRAIRAPRWIQRIGLEWLHRLLKEPWRWRRMAALPKFAIKVLLQGRRS